jgi:hypothetical protein
MEILQSGHDENIYAYHLLAAINAYPGFLDFRGMRFMYFNTSIVQAAACYAVALSSITCWQTECSLPKMRLRWLVFCPRIA